MLPLAGLVGGSTAGGPVAAAESGRIQILPSRQPTASPSPTSPPRIVTRPPAAKPEATVRRSARAKPLKIAAGGPGTFRTATISGATAGERGKLLRYRVRIEKGLPFDPETTAIEIQRTLSDPRSWAGSGLWRMKLVGAGQRADFSVLVATPRTTDRLCAPLLTRGKVSCQSGNEAVLNARRWAFGVSYYKGDVDAYRIYLANHEVGHILGFGHERCPSGGRAAPVMQQQTKGLQGCRANPWPAPRRG